VSPQAWARAGEGTMASLGEVNIDKVNQFLSILGWTAAGIFP
jgi:hypothetical protein